MTTINQENHFNMNYSKILQYSTGIIVLIFNLLISLLSFYVYPNVYEAYHTETFVSLTVLFGIILTNYYIYLNKNLPYSYIILAHATSLFNALVAIYVIELDYYTSYIFISFFIISMIVDKFIVDNESNRFMYISIIMLGIANIISWNFEGPISQKISYEIMGLLLFFTVISFYYSKTVDNNSLELVPVIELFFMIPILLKSDYTVSIINFVPDFIFGVFSLILILRLVSDIRRNKNDLQIIYTLIAEILVYLIMFMEYEISKQYHEESFDVKSLQLMSNVITIPSLIYLIIIGYGIFAVNKISLQKNKIIALFSATIFLTTVFIFTGRIKYMSIYAGSELVIDIGLILLSISLLISREKLQYYSFPLILSAFIITTFLPDVQFSKTVHSITFILILIIAIIGWLSSRDELELIGILSAFSSTILINLLLYYDYKQTTVHFDIITIVSLCLIILLILTKGGTKLPFSIFAVSVSIASLSYSSGQDYLISGLQTYHTNIINSLTLLFIGTLIYLNYKFRQIQRISDSIILSAIGIVVALVTLNKIGINTLVEVYPIVFSLLLLVPSISILTSKQSTNGTELYYQSFGIILYGILQDQPLLTGVISNFNYISLIFLISSVLIIGKLYNERSNISLLQNYLINNTLIEIVFTYIMFYNLSLADQLPHYLIIAFLIILNSLLLIIFNNEHEWILVSNLIQISLISRFIDHQIIKSKIEISVLRLELFQGIALSGIVLIVYSIITLSIWLLKKDLNYQIPSVLTALLIILSIENAFDIQSFVNDGSIMNLIFILVILATITRIETISNELLVSYGVTSFVLGVLVYYQNTRFIGNKLAWFTLLPYAIIMLYYQIKLNKEGRVVLLYTVGAVNLLYIIFPLIGSFELLILPVILNLAIYYWIDDDTSIQITSITNSVLSMLIMVVTPKKLIYLDSYFKFNDPSLIVNSSIILVVSIILYLAIKTGDYKTWIVANSSISALLVFATLMQDTLKIYPITIPTMVVLISIQLIFKHELYVKLYTSAFQLLILLVMAINPSFVDLPLVDSISISVITLSIWVAISLTIWMYNGINTQLFSILSVIFLISGIQSSIFVIRLYTYSLVKTDLYLLLILMILAVVTTYLFRDELKSFNSTYLISIIISALFGVIAYIYGISNLMSETELQLIRLVVDWLIFIPLFVQSILYIRPYVENYYINNTDEDKADLIILVVIGGFILTAILIGSERIFIMKLVIIAAAIWIFAATLVRNKIAWFASIYSVMVYGYLILQLSASDEAITGPTKDSDIVLYFLAIAAFGIVMTIVAIINELKYQGEPLTTSLIVTGSVITFVAIITPLLTVDPNGKPFTFLDAGTGFQIIQFLPNLFWALQGLILFVFGLKHSKGYLRRLALSILIVDIGKTGFEVFKIQNDLIKIIGAIVLGGVLIFIFNLFSLQEEKEIT